jgi:hypothetical protein
MSCVAISLWSRWAKQKSRKYLAAQSAEARLPEGLAKLLSNYSEGNPLFIVALDHTAEW